MKREFLLGIMGCSLGAAAFMAQGAVRNSSRNFQSLSARAAAQKEVSAASASGRAGIAVAQPKAEASAQETVSRVEFLGPKSGWGILKERSPFYSEEGKNLGKMPAGTVFSYNGVKQTRRNPMLVVTLQAPPAAGLAAGPYLMDCTRVASYEGNLASMDPAMVKQLGAYFTLKGKMEDRKDELEEQAFAKNPYFETARASRQAYQDSLDKAAKMEEQMNRLQGSMRSRAQDQLRAFKYQQVKIEAKADQDAKAYKAWKLQHPVDPSVFQNDPQIKELQGQLQSAGVSVKNLIPNE